MITHHLREFNGLRRYVVVTDDTALGKLAGLLFEPGTWKIRAFVVGPSGAGGTRTWIPARRFQALDDAGQRLVVAAGDAGVSEAASCVDASALIGKPLEARDGQAGRVTDLMVNVDVWQLRYFIVSTSRGVVLTDIEWTNRVPDPAVDLPVSAIVSAPVYAGLEDMCSGYEESLYRHYTRRTFQSGYGVN